MRDDTMTTRTITRRLNASVAAALACARELRLLKMLQPLAARAHRRDGAGSRLANPFAVACVLAVSGCAGNSSQPETRSEPISSPAQMCHIDRALLIPPRAPDCGFGRADLKTVDPEQWTHLKLEFERKCFQNAEKITRERLRHLQAAAKCEIVSAQR